MNNTTFQILKSVLDGDTLKVAQANTTYEVINAVYDSDSEALRVNITNLPPDEGSKWEDSGETQIIPKDGKHIDASIIDNLEKNIGITLNDEYISGVKSLIELDDVLNIPENYQYNIVGNLTIDGEINGGGVVNLITDTFIDGFTLSGYELIIENNDGVDLSVDLEPIISTASGSEGEIQFNKSGYLGSTSSLTFTNDTLETSNFYNYGSNRVGFTNVFLDEFGLTYSVQDDDYIILVHANDQMGDPTVVTEVYIEIPSEIISIDGKIIQIKDADGQAETIKIIISCEGMQLIDGDLTYEIIDAYNSITIMTANNQCYII